MRFSVVPFTPVLEVWSKSMWGTDGPSGVSGAGPSSTQDKLWFVGNSGVVVWGQCHKTGANSGEFARDGGRPGAAGVLPHDGRTLFYMLRYSRQSYPLTRQPPDALECENRLDRVGYGFVLPSKMLASRKFNDPIAPTRLDVHRMEDSRKAKMITSS